MEPKNSQDTKQKGPAEGERESSDSGIVSPEKNRILEQHAREFPEGDPAVRRQNPDRGEIPITERDGSVMHVHEKKKAS